MVPGVSRSAASIIGGMQQKLTRNLAAEFSFFLAVPTMAAATGYKLLKTFKEHPEVLQNKQNLLLLGIGNVVAFVMKYDRLEFPEAVRMLAEKANIVIPENRQQDKRGDDNYQKILEINALASDFFHQCLLFERSDAAEEARNYLKKRQVSLETVKQLKIGYAPDSWDKLINHLNSKAIPAPLMAISGLVSPRQNGNGFYDRFRNRIMFPILDVRGQYRAFGGRTMNNDPAKYVNSPETPVYVKGQHLFGLNQARTAIADQDSAVIVEGYMDCVMPHQFGFQNVVASLGTALTVEQIRLLARYTKNITLLFDADAAGEAATMRSLDLLVDYWVCHT